jgi:ElaB/YqjD/DUF883 family membrane-anchored ribosome-binding protein
VVAKKFDATGSKGFDIRHTRAIIHARSKLAKRHFPAMLRLPLNAEKIMPESTESKIAAKKLESSTEHAKKALDAATEATKAVGQTVKQHAQVVMEVGKEHLSAAAKDLGEAASATCEDMRGIAKTKADEIQCKAKAAWGDATTRAQSYQSETESYIRENPLKAVGIAVGVGFLLGVIFRR